MKKIGGGNSRSLEDLLENRAKKIVRGSRLRDWDSSPSNIVQREIALTLDHIKGVETLDDDLEYRKLKMETYIGTHLLNLHRAFVPDYWEQKYKLHRQLQEIEMERWKQKMRKEDQLQTLREKLLSLLNKHGQLDF